MSFEHFYFIIETSIKLVGFVNFFYDTFAECKESQFYSLSFGQAVDSMY